MIGRLFLAVPLILTAAASAQVQKMNINYDENKVPAYTLPDPLVCLDGSRVTTAEQWQDKRRPELMRLFEEQMFGRTPVGRPASMRFELTDEDRGALGGSAIRKQVRVRFADGDAPGRSMEILIYLPKKAAGPAPLFVGLNFYGNHTIHKDPAIHITQSWARANKDFGVVNNRGTEAGRGARSNRWPVEQILQRGYGVATIYYGDIFPDHKDGWDQSVIPLFYKPGQTQPAPEEWGAIGAWAWGLSRAMDYFQTDKDIDARHVAVMGHSRLGKTSLWAGAQDPRFAIVISNNSGAGGAALNKRIFGETVAVLNRAFPHWFNDNFNQYSDAEHKMPVDAHELVAMMAPRPVLVCSAEEDRWADPHGEFLSVYHAGPVFALFGKTAPQSQQMPALNQPLLTTAGYVIRPGKHDVLPTDWQVYMDFADKHRNR